MSKRPAVGERADISQASQPCGWLVSNNALQLNLNSIDLYNRVVSKTNTLSTKSTIFFYFFLCVLQKLPSSSENCTYCSVHSNLFSSSNSRFVVASWFCHNLKEAEGEQILR